MAILDCRKNARVEGRRRLHPHIGNAFPVSSRRHFKSRPEGNETTASLRLVAGVNRFAGQNSAARK